jgi:hypothetical protein
MNRIGRRSTLAAFLVVAVLCPSILEAAGSAGRITGRIKDKDGAALIGAVITVFKPDKSGGTISFTRSDKNGSYSLANLTPGSYYLQVTHQGYQPVTTANVRIDPGRTVAMDVILQEFLSYISNDSDPRNWDIRAVMRGSSDRRLIFRDLPGTLQAEYDSPFYRSGVMNITSSSGLGGENYSVFPSQGKSGVLSNFAYTEPVSPHGRMIFSGQLNSGYDSYWRVRNTFNYRPDPDRDMKFSVGYGRMNVTGANISSVARPAQFFSEDPSMRESGVQTVAVGFEGSNRFLDTMAVEYGFDFSRLYYGPTKSFFSPYLQIVLTPWDTWVFKAAISSKRFSDNNSLVLPDGEVLNLMEPTYITDVDGTVRLSQFKHSEVSVGKLVAEGTAVEMAVYEDHMNGPGAPFVVTSVTQDGTSSKLAQLSDSQSAQRGMRVSVNRRILDCLNGSIAYVYGTATSPGAVDDNVSTEILARNLLNHMQRSYYNSVTGQLTANIPRTRTNLSTIVRWYPGDPVTPIDLFADRMDILTKGVNFRLRQAIPLPDFMGNAGRWEALVDVRNLFDQGGDVIRTTDGELILTRNPRSLRFGLNLNFY